MKNFLQNLLIFFSFCLCALIAFQWVRETDLRTRLQKLTDQDRDKAEAIQNLNAQSKRYEAEIQRLDAANKQMNQTLTSNDVQIAALSRNLDKVTADAEHNEKQAEAYKEAYQKANDNVIQQNETIRKANDELKKLADDRNGVVAKFNELAEKYKELVDKWNAQQEELAKAATNAPAKK